MRWTLASGLVASSSVGLSQQLTVITFACFIDDLDTKYIQSEIRKVPLYNLSRSANGTMRMSLCLWTGVILSVV